MDPSFDAVFLARLQFAFTITFHFVFPSFTIGLASYLAVLEGLWLKTGDDTYIDLYRYWLKIFSLVFGMGVVSGVVMSYQFGTNWSVFSEKAGPIIGPLMAYEVMTAFFLEAGFLGVMLFGMKKVGKGLHFFASCMVAIGTLVSATWIIAVNSWMQTPAGYAINDAGQFVPAGSWVDVIFTASFPYRLIHTVLASYLATAFAVGSVAAWHLLRHKNTPAVRKMFSMAMWMAAIVTPIQMFAGDEHGRNTLEHQPVKVLAMEGDYDPSPNGAHLVVFGWPDNEEARVRYQVAIPSLGSLILKHDPTAPLPGMKDFPRENWPPTAVIFWSFRIMVGLALYMLAIGMWSLVSRWRSALYAAPWLHRAALLAGPAGFVAIIAGWVTTEVGRQPWTIYGVMRTVDSASPIAAPAVATSLIAFVVVYFIVFGAGIYYVLRLMGRPPAEHEPGLAAIPQRAAGITPVSVSPTESIDGERHDT
jgi:cytochrome d ubiquinol oxidase subunit I